MSTILKALKRLDEQRRADSSPRTLEEQVLGAGGARRPDRSVGRARWLFHAGGVALALSVALGGWIALRDGESEAPASTVNAARVATPAPAPAPTASTQPSLGMPTTTTPIDDALRADRVVESARSAAVPTSALPPRGDEPEPEPTSPETAVSAPLRALAAQGPANTAFPRPSTERTAPIRPAPAPAPEDASAASPAAPRAAREPSPEAVASDEPALRTEPADVASSARRDVWVERTQWHPTAEKRSAFVRSGDGEARELREGDVLDGVVVKEIRPSGVLFLRDGAEWRRGVGER